MLDNYGAPYSSGYPCKTFTYREIQNVSSFNQKDIEIENAECSNSTTCQVIPFKGWNVWEDKERPEVSLMDVPSISFKEGNNRSKK